MHSQHWHPAGEHRDVDVAILLAAGVSRRLQPYLNDRPKCLLEFDSTTLLERHVANLHRLGVPRMVIVTGYRGEQIHQVLASKGLFDLPMQITLAANADFEKGSILSLRTGLAAAQPQGDIIVMDADVLYHPDVLGRLVAAPGSMFLLDQTSDETGEEMMLGTRGGRVVKVARSVAGEPWDEVGETVGFFRIGAGDVPLLSAFIDDVVAEGLLRDEYETAVQRLLDVRRAGYVRVGDLPWTEIDFKEDVEKAQEKILPHVRAAEALLRPLPLMA